MLTFAIKSMQFVTLRACATDKVSRGLGPERIVCTMNQSLFSKNGRSTCFELRDMVISSGAYNYKFYITTNSGAYGVYIKALDNQA